MNIEEQELIIKNYLKEQHVCVISTLNSNNIPESAAMAFSEDNNLNIIFQTPNSTRKYTNLLKNVNVSIVVGWSLDDFITVQYEGQAREAVGDEINWCREIHTQKNEKSRVYADIPENKYFIVKPTWIRYSDVNNRIIFELKY